MRPRVLALYPRPVLGGTERLVLDHLRRIDPATCDYSAVALRRGDLESSYASFPNHACLRATCRMDPWAVARLHRLARSRRIDVVHTHLQEADFYGYLLKRLDPSLVWVSTRHNTDRFRTHPWWRWGNRVMGAAANRVVAVSRAVASFIVRNECVPPERVVVIHNGVDTERFSPGPAPPGLRASLGIESGRFVVGIAGRLAAQKGHQALLQAVAAICAEAPNLHVLIVGEGDLDGRLRRTARRAGIAGRVTFAGFRPDMPEMYRAMDALCMPSLFEGFGLALVEAMACGKVVVGTRVDGIAEIVEANADGLLVEPGDTDALSRALQRVYRGEFDQAMPARARAKAVASFDIERNVREIERLYVGLLADRRR